MKHLFIINPAAGKKDRSKQICRVVEEKLGTSGQEYEIYITKAPMDACEKIRREAASGTSLRAYACGGDGTLNECINGAANCQNVAVTHYPTGTGNDFVKSFGEDAALFSDLDALLQGEPLPLDLIRCNGRYGVSICSVGVDARIGGDVHKYSGISLIGGATGYVSSLVVNILKGINQELDVCVEGRRYTGERSLVCACNGSFYGGGFNPVPEAVPDDGVMDILIVEGISRIGFLRMVGRYAKGRYAEIPQVTREAGRQLEIHCPETLAVNVDGEILWDNDIRMDLCPGAVSFIFPRGSSFLKSRKEKTEEKR